MQVFDFGISVFEHFFDPKKRLFIGYLIAALGIAFFWLLISKKFTIRNALRKIFDRSVFFSTSSRADFKVFLINRAFTLFISPLLLTQLVVAHGLLRLSRPKRLWWPHLPFVSLCWMISPNISCTDGCINGLCCGRCTKCTILHHI